MAFGRPEKKHRIRAVFAAALLLAACGTGSKDFPAALKALDAETASASALELSATKLPKSVSAALRRAERSAATSADWLALMKRAERFGPAGFEGLMLSALQAMPSSEPVLRAAAYLYLRHDLPEKALRLFASPGSARAGGRLSPDAYPGLWAEACLRAGARAADWTSPETSLRLASLLNEPRFRLDAAYMALSRGDRHTAELIANELLRAAARVPPALLWDAGLYEALAGGDAAGLRSTELAIKGDASHLLGKKAEAEALWLKALRQDPGMGWKPYAKLALSMGGTPASTEGVRAMAGLFKHDPEALRFAAAYFFSRGDRPEADTLLKEAESAQPKAPLNEEWAALQLLRLAILGQEQPEARYSAELLRFVEEHPESAAAREELFLKLIAAGRFEDFLAVYESTPSESPQSRIDWFFGAVASMATGGLGKAAEILEAKGPAYPGPEASFTLGLVYAKRGDHKRALKLYETSLGAARSGQEKAAILKEIGRSQGSLGNKDQARLAYLAAVSANPDDAEAGFLAAQR